MTSPFKLTKIYQGLTSKNQLLKRKLKLGTSEIPIPAKRDDVATIEAINRFNKANPRVDTTNLKPLSVKHSNIKQSNVNEPNEGVIQSAFDTATKEAQFEGYPAPSYEKFKSRYLKKNMKADGGMLVQPSDDGSRPGYADDKKKTFNPNPGKELTINQQNIIKKKFPKVKFNFKDYPVIGVPTKNTKYKSIKDFKNKSVYFKTGKKPINIGGAANLGKGQFSLAELNRVSRIKYNKNYMDLKDSKQKANIRSNLIYSQASGAKIKKKTFLTPLTEIQQKKILLEFPNADFSKGKFGFSSTEDQTNFSRVKKFIARGYKPRFKQLPLKIQNQLKEKFSEFKDWDFKNYKYGVPNSATIKENNKLAQKVKTFINDPKPYMFGFSLDKPGAWMTQQMYRAWEHGNTDYKPKYNKNGKVVGMYEKGKLYYANKNVADIDGAKKAKLINSHPEFNNVQKFVDVAEEAKLPLKKLGGYTNTKALMALFPEGFESVKFSDLVNYIYKEAGADATRNAIEKHHLKNLSDLGAPVDSKNLQLLRQDLNTLGNTITQQIKKGDLSRIEDLEKAGVKITVDGQTYGKGFQDPKRQLNKIIGEVTEKVSSLDEKQIKKLIASFGGGTCSVFSNKKAEGGRIGLQGGTPNIDDCFKSGSAVINSGKVPVDKADDFAQLLKRAGNIGRGVMKFGIIPEAMFVAADSLVRVGMGDTFTEAGLRASDYLLPGDQTKAAEMSKVSRFFGDETGQLVGRVIDYKNQLGKIQSLESQKANLENLSGGGEFDYIGDLNSDVKNIDNLLVQARNDLDNKFQISEAEQIFGERRQDEAYDASKADSFFTNLKAKYRDIEPDSDIETLGSPEKTQLQLNLNMLPNFTEAMKNPEIRKDLDYINLPEKNIREYFTTQGTPEEIDSFLQYQKNLKDAYSLSNLSNTFGKEQVYGTQGTPGGEPVDMTNYKPSNRFGSGFNQRPVLYPQGRNPLELASGGIASLTKTVPPESGPTPHGLPSLMKRGIKI